MTTQNQSDKDAKVSTTLKDDAASTDIKRELTDEEIASVAGGVGPVTGSSSSGPTSTKTNTLLGPAGTGPKA
jgi:hypothetical protein